MWSNNGATKFITGDECGVKKKVGCWGIVSFETWKVVYQILQERFVAVMRLKTAAEKRIFCLQHDKY